MLILITSVYKFTTTFLQAFHALYIGTWAVTTKREPLSFSLSLIITFHPLRFLLGPTRLSVTPSLSASPRHFILGCPLRFGLSYVVVEAGQHMARLWDRACPVESTGRRIVKNVHDVGLGRGRVGDRCVRWLW